MDLISTLHQSELFSGLSEEILARHVAPQGQLQHFSKGQYPIVPQQRVDQFSILLAGKVHVLHLFPDGSYSLMSVLTPPKVLGADLACTRTRLAPYHAIAAADTTVLSFPVELLTCPGRLPEEARLAAAGRLLTLIAQENMKKEYRLAILSQKSLRGRIMTYLSMQVSKRGTSTITIPFSREELASFLCVNRAALSHELSLMQQEGLITFRKSTFTLHTPPSPAPPL